ncbi:unnamed protein product [Meloidogyne enterolobii]|uniref:Uncharacterized protein n=1 Tax=Meloidogyne enterolobii TaxID=390850 RepID=A0ACB1AGU4_MELEN
MTDRVYRVNFCAISPLLPKKKQGRATADGKTAEKMEAFILLLLPFSLLALIYFYFLLPFL